VSAWARRTVGGKRRGAYRHHAPAGDRGDALFAAAHRGLMWLTHGMVVNSWAAKPSREFPHATPTTTFPLA
jgi:hypothetical protein